ncbi:acid protease [Schizopora paradoxa]|uniref:Acid protease n=1 Tax=Schizopora paradoxa TaxID=27342 RepID=A0A0H2R7X0_9AGAM|nr:acid protease [Schizopora paradoxa]
MKSIQPRIAAWTVVLGLASKSFGSPSHFNRGNAGNANASNTTAILPLTNFANQAYAVPISINGLEFLAQPDLGSTDLVAFAEAFIPNATNLTIPVADKFGEGEAIGFLEQGTAGIGNFAIPNQTFTQFQTEGDFDGPTGLNGILGLGPRFFSISFYSLAGTPRALMVPDRIFAANPGIPHILTIQYSRILSDDKGAVSQDGGNFTVGTVLSDDGLEAVQEQPKLPVSQDPSTILHQHWEVLLDADGITGPDGRPINTTSVFKNSGSSDKRQLRAFFDSGFTFPSVPENVASAIYGRVPGASLNASASPPYWTVPCDYELNISFSFAGVEYPIHPLDVSVPYDIANQTLPNGTCMGTFQPSDFAANAAMGAGNYDIIMGMPFLRNVYFLLDFGNYTAAADPNGPDAFIQLLSTTNKTRAHEEFVDVRLGGNDTTGSQPPLQALSQ